MSVFLLNGVMMLCCLTISGIEVVAGHPAAAFAYVGFGAGYAGLAMLYFPPGLI